MAGNLADLVSVAAAHRPGDPALIAAGVSTSWAELDAAVDAAARAFTRRDLRFGDRVAFLLDNHPDVPVLYLGALRAGLVVAPLDPATPAAEVAATLREVGARMLICDARTAPVAVPAAGGLAEVVLRADAPAAAERPAPGPTVADLLAEGRAASSDAGLTGSHIAEVPGGEALAVLLPTAGTAGRPKRAMLTHRALLANLAQCARLDPAPVQRGDVVLLALPLFAAFGLNAVLGQALYAGATTLLATDPEPGALLELVVDRAATSVAGTPQLYAAWAAHPAARDALAGVRVLVSGGAPLAAATAAAFRDATGKPVWQGYGLTEAAPVVSAAMRAKPGSVGRPLPGVEVRLLDRDGSEVAVGDPGELWVRGPNLFSGYWPDGQGKPGADGWLATGDLAIADAEGDLFVVSTRSDVVEVDGFPVYPDEVEDALLAMPGVAEAAVVGLPGRSGSAALVAFLVPDPGAVLDPDAVRGHCAERLARFKVPGRVELVTRLPRSVTGRIARARLRERAERGLDGAGTEAAG